MGDTFPITSKDDSDWRKCLLHVGGSEAESRETGADSWMDLLLSQPGQTLTASVPPINDFMAASAWLHPPGLPGKALRGGDQTPERPTVA